MDQGQLWPLRFAEGNPGVVLQAQEAVDGEVSW